MKKLIAILIILPIVALFVAAMFGVPTLDYVAKFFGIIGNVFNTVARWCSFLQRFLDLGIFK